MAQSSAMILIAHGFELGFGFLNECGFEIGDRLHRYLGLTMKRAEIVGLADAIAMGAFFQQLKSPVGFGGIDVARSATFRSENMAAIATFFNTPTIFFTPPDGPTLQRHCTIGTQ